MHLKTPKFSSLLISLLAFSLPSIAQIHVSPSGNDANDGSQARPVESLQRARDLARALKGTSTRDVTVWLAGGTYRLPSPLRLTSADSGANGHNVVYAASPGQHPVVSGGVRVTGWRLVDAARNLWSAPAPASARNTRQLYVNGVRATRTRGRVPVALEQTGTGYIASTPALAVWRNASDMEFVYTGGNSIWSERSVGLGSWTEPRCPVASIDGTIITMAQPCWDNSTKRVLLPNGTRTANLVGPKGVGLPPTYIENAYELLGTPGQFYFDRPASTIYYVPRKSEDLAKADVEMPVLESLIDGTGTAAAPIHNIVFRGIQFSFATWLGPSSNEGFSEIQANYRLTGPDGYSRQGLCTLVPGGFCPYGAWTKEPGNVSFTFGHAIRFYRDAFVHLGAAGLDLGDGTQDSIVEGSVFSDISGNGVELGGVDGPLVPDAEFTGNNRIENNLFKNIGSEYRGGIGIVVGYARRTTVAHNLLEHLPYAAISIGWGGWPDKIKQAGQTNYSEQNVAADNLIRDFMLVLSDGGGIYTQGRTGKTLRDGEKLTGNVIHDQYSSGHGIYTDNGSSIITVDRNVIFHTNHDNWGSRHRDYYDGEDGKNFDPLAILNNYWEQGDSDSQEGNVIVQGNHLIGALTAAPASLLQSAGLERQFRDIAKLEFSRKTAPEAPSRASAYAEDGFAYVTWSPSVFEGGAPVESYTVTSSDGKHVTISAADFWKHSYVKFPQLENGRSVSFTVAAANSQGTSVPSLPSEKVTPSDRRVDLPLAPSHVSAHAGEGIVSIHFASPPAEDGESEQDPIVAYAVTVNPGARKVMFTGRNVLALQGTRHTTFNVIDGLKRGASYTFSVSAVNAAGEGAPATVGPVQIP